MVIPRYKCLNTICNKIWDRVPQSLIVYDEDLNETRNLGKTTDCKCPYCGSDYVYWVNFEEVARRKR